MTMALYTLRIGASSDQIFAVGRDQLPKLDKRDHGATAVVCDRTPTEPDHRMRWTGTEWVPFTITAY
jgi:hypothetical protein